MKMKICINASCRKTTTSEWKQGWELQLGGYTDLCYECGSAYENLEFCNTFHSEEAGWRNCFTCDKRLHCGCIVSKHLFEHRDLGGVVCTSCPRDPQNYNHDGDHVQDAINQVSDDSSGEYFSPSESDSETTAETRNTKRKGRRPTRNTKRKGRRPVGGQGESVLLSRYDPKITKQQLGKMRQDLGCDVVPLFEKVLSASDVGKIGRIVLPRACAEAYLPPIDEPDGIPLLIQDVQGNDYNFRLRFWPNNRTRMYVVEGAMHFVQALQLEADDTIIFSRTDPGRKLVLGIRRASKSKGKQHAQTSTSSTGARAVETSSSSHSDVPNIGSKHKRLQMNRAEALELRSTWEEPPRLLCASPNFVPNVVTLGQDYDILEYDEPPIFGKQTKFITLSSGVREQWAQCDDCSKWRKLPFDVLLPAKWTCSENTWDAIRCSCQEDEEISSKELHTLFRAENQRKNDKSALEMLTRAVIGENRNNGEQLTSKHPNHRDDCTCIICCQPLRGMGKHISSCKCKSCETNIRRQKTKELKKKKKLRSR